MDRWTIPVVRVCVCVFGGGVEAWIPAGADESCDGPRGELLDGDIVALMRFSSALPGEANSECTCSLTRDVWK